MPTDISRRRFLRATGGTAAAAALAGCSGGDGPATETTEDPSGDDSDGSDGTGDTETDDGSDGRSDAVYRRVTAGVNTLDPIKATGVDAGEVIHQLFDGLTNYPNGESAVELLVADGYETSDGGRGLTFELRDDVTFSDGRSVTAHDFAYAMERLAESEHSRQGSFLTKWLGVEHDTDGDDEYVPGSLGVEATDEHTLEIRLDEPFHASLELLAYDPFAAVPEGIVGDVEGYDGEVSHEEFVNDPIGAGPYTLETWEKSTKIELEARPMDEYHGEGPYTSGTHFKYIEGTNATYTYATTNTNADYPAVPAAEYDESKISIEGTDDKGRKYGTYGPLANGITADYYRMPVLATYYIGFNTNQVEKAARQAWAYLYDREEIDEKISAGPSNNAYFFTPPSLFPGGATEYDDLKEDYPYGIGETRMADARQVMEDAGYSENDRYEFTFAIGESDALEAEGQLMQDKFKNAHVDLEIKQTPSSTLKDQIRNGNVDAFLLSWWADYPAADNFLQMLYPPNTQTDDPDSRSYFNWGGTDAADRATAAWEDDFLPNRQPTEAGQEARDEAYLEMEKAVWEDVPVVTSTHYLSEHFDYPWVDKPRVGAMGAYRQKHNTVRIGDRDEYM